MPHPLRVRGVPGRRRSPAGDLGILRSPRGDQHPQRAPSRGEQSQGSLTSSLLLELLGGLGEPPPRSLSRCCSTRRSAASRGPCAAASTPRPRFSFSTSCSRVFSSAMASWQGSTVTPQPCGAGGLHAPPPHPHLEHRQVPQQLLFLQPPPAGQQSPSIAQSPLGTGTGVLAAAGEGAGGRGGVTQGPLHGRLLGAQLADGLPQGPLLRPLGHRGAAGTGKWWHRAGHGGTVLGTVLAARSPPTLVPSPVPPQPGAGAGPALLLAVRVRSMRELRPLRGLRTGPRPLLQAVLPCCS